MKKPNAPKHPRTVRALDASALPAVIGAGDPPPPPHLIDSSVYQYYDAR